MRAGNNHDAAFPTGDLDSLYERYRSMLGDSSNSYEKEARFAAKLQAMGFQDHDVLILVERFVNSKTFDQIAKDHGFVSKQVVHSLYTKAINTLKKMYNAEKAPNG